MDHGHGGHGGHSDMPGMPMCVTHMLWNTQILDTCIVFSAWHIHSHVQFVLSFFAIVALGVCYEYLRVFSRGVDARMREQVGLKGKRALSPSPASERSTPERQAEDVSLINGRRVRPATRIPPHYRALRALLYGASVLLSAFLMLVLMTYNAYLISAVAIGAAIGHYLFSGSIEPDSKGMACH